MRNRKWISVLLAVVLLFQVLAMTACSDGTASTDTPSSGDEPTTSTGDTPDDGETVEPRYRMNFVTGAGAQQVATIVAEEGDRIEAPATPSYPKHTFGGWFTDYGTYENQYVFGTMPGDNVTLYAKWISGSSDAEATDYEKTLNETSQEGHLYIHYLRFNNTPEEYEALNMWVWPEYSTGRTFEWNRDASGEIIVDAVAGVTCDVDLTKFYTDAGKDEHTEMQYLWTTDGEYKPGDIKNPENYVDARLGFLIVYKDSKGIAGQHWRSDGGNQYFELETAIWDNGSVHIFCVQDNISEFVYHIAEQGEIVNPYENDDGSHISTGNVNSSEVIPVKYGTKLLDTVSGVGYQIMVASFADSNGDGIGDIQGIIQNLDYIEKLNVDVLWLTPIQLSDSYHGYDIIDYKAVDPRFGTLDDYKELLEKCHAKNIKVIMDLVLNHKSTNNVWFQKSVKMTVEDGIDYRNFYQWINHEDKANANKNEKTGWYPYSEYAYSYYAKFSPSMPELNYDNQDTRDAIVDVAKYWLGILGEGKGGVDGFRIDAVKHIYMADEVAQSAGDIVINDYDDATQSDYSSNLTKNINFFTYFTNQIKAKYPNCYLVGENFDGHAYNVAPYYTAFDGMLDFYMYYNFGELATYPTAAASLSGANSSNGGSVPTGKNTDQLKGGSWNFASILATQADYSMHGLVGYTNGTDGTIMGSLFTSNHDIPRLMNNVVRNYQGANWKAGEVTASNKATAERNAKAVISAMMTLPGISWVYYGDEIGMSSNYANGENESSPHADRASRQPFKWESTVTGYTTHFSISGDTTLYVEWDDYNKTIASADQQAADQNSFLNLVRYWTEKKSTDEVLRYGNYEFIHAWGPQAAQLLSFKRTYNGTTYWCLTNFGADEADVSSMVNGNTVKYQKGYNNGRLAGGSTMVIKMGA